MTEVDRHALWDRFLEEWPVDRVREMTLQEYTNLDRSDAFVYWLEQVTEALGRIGGGSAFKWGVYHRHPDSTPPTGPGMSSGETYSWSTTYGGTAAEAFETIRGRLLEVIEAAQEGDLTTIEQMTAGWPIYKWKVAFLYQDRDHPKIFPVFRKRCLTAHYLSIEPDGEPTRTVMYPYLLNHYSSHGDLFEIATHVFSKPDGPDESSLTTPEREVTSRSMVLYGPPGTGKTWKTTVMALELTHPNDDVSRWGPDTRRRRFDELRRRGRVEFVTFHPSYGYEDFIEGIRPTLSDERVAPGEVGYELAHGVFKRMALDAIAAGMVRSESPRASEDERFEVADAQQALDDRNSDAYRFVFGPETEQFVLIIDEINRGNVSRVFGEMMTLLEPSRRLGMPDETRLRLATSPEHVFALPPNLHVVATMNTADRSIALMDTALRRRFEFVEVMPSASVLARTLAGADSLEDVDDADHRLTVALFASLNERVSLLYDRDHQLGHAYFMAASTPLALAEVVSKKILPLLQEYFHGSWERVCDALGCAYDERGASRRGLDPRHALVRCRVLTVADVLGYEPAFDEPRRLEHQVNEVLDSSEPETLRPVFAAALTASWRAYYEGGHAPEHVAWRTP